MEASIDLHFLQTSGVDLQDALRLAASKDGGIGADTLLMVLPHVPATGPSLEFRNAWVSRLRLDLFPS